MDKEQARFILRSFRPDGADADDHDFAEALQFAAENRELGEWLAHERAFDAAFAQALGTVDLPETLREDILACLAAERGDFPQAADRFDAACIGAMASIQPPASLRDELLTAMERTASVSAAPVSSRFRWFAVPFAAAAGIALAFFVTRREETAPVADTRTVTIDAVQAGFVSTYQRPFFHLDEKEDDRHELISHLQKKKLPCPGCLPPGLEHLKPIGCRKLEIDGKKGSLMCFSTGDGEVVHVVIFRRQDVCTKLPPMENPDIVTAGDWSTARWEHGGKVFLMISKARPTTLASLF